MARGLTMAAIRDRVAKRTGIPPSVVANVLDVALSEIRQELMGQGEIHFRGLFRLSTREKVVVTADKKRLRRVLLHVKPVRSFREKLNTLTPPE